MDWETHFIDSVAQETHCDGCGCDLRCGDKALLDVRTFAIACSIECGNQFNAAMTAFNRDIAAITR